MRKNKLEKQIVKALAIGISASMALQPMTALAGTKADESSDAKASTETTDTTDSHET
ncbi:hypothetical protein [Oribacterium sp. P6A1]|uniref:hypothetical protein n=1 Tax=Oribacterium sp. P6A1 TaxID=1410612 RepID=UPI000A682AA4|nr:hypothetical protein [Oribacterium sp. P6A1]